VEYVEYVEPGAKLEYMRNIDAKKKIAAPQQAKLNNIFMQTFINPGTQYWLLFALTFIGVFF